MPWVVAVVSMRHVRARALRAQCVDHRGTDASVVDPTKRLPVEIRSGAATLWNDPIRRCYKMLQVDVHQTGRRLEPSSRKTLKFRRMRFSAEVVREMLFERS